jgi:acyl-CoA synthetase (AMP-forming)/AMP-acid ligase II
MLVSDIPEIAAHHAADKPALLFQDRRWTFAQLRDRSWQLSNALLTLAKPHDRVAILAENCPEYTEAYYGVPGAGMGLVFLNYRLAPRELVYILNDSAPSVLLVQPKYLETIRKIRPELTSVQHVVVIGDGAADAFAYEELIARGKPHAPPVRPDENDLAWLLYTSGTTGLPKGAMLSHRNLLAAMLNAMSGGAEAPPDEICLFMFPQFHVAGYVMPMYHLRNWPVVLLDVFDAVNFLKAVERHRVTSAPIAPTMLAMLLENPETQKYDLSSLRSLGYGASSMPLEVLRRARRQWPGVGFATGFGMTELAGNVMSLSKDDHERAAEQDLEILRSVGRQMPLARVRVLLEDNSDAPPNVPGEIVVKGDQVLTGYWNNEKATKESFIDGWFRTGDVGRWDENGYLYIVDRKKDMILTGGENVYPREVEEVLYTHPAIVEAAVIGIPDPKWGESVVAVLHVRDSEPAPAEIIAFCKERIASYKKPRFVAFVAELPKNASGKVLKRELRARIADGTLEIRGRLKRSVAEQVSAQTRSD